MTTIELAIAVAIDLLATAGLILLAARVYETAILRIGAPVKLRRILAGRPRQNSRPISAHASHDTSGRRSPTARCKRPRWCCS